MPVPAEIELGWLYASVLSEGRGVNEMKAERAANTPPDQVPTTSPHVPPGVRVWIDGKKVEADSARVSVFDRGFLYGDSVFETLRTYGGAPFALDEHLERLAESARRVLIELPVPLDRLRREVAEAVSAVVSSGLTECYARIMVTRGIGALGLDPGSAVHPLRVLLVGPLHPPPPTLYEEGISVVTYCTTRKNDATEAEGAKIGNYLVAVLANRKATEAGAKEALICDPEGRVVEGATSNVFWVEGNTLCTPGVDAGILAGITRAHILAVAREAGIEVRFFVPTIEQLALADEVFISSSIRELLPVVQIDGRPVHAGTPGPMTKNLLDRFRAQCRALAHATAQEPEAARPNSR